MAQSGGASTSLARAVTGLMGEEARRSQDRCGTHGRKKATGVEEKETEENQPRPGLSYL
jgi:hypothetical protein